MAIYHMSIKVGGRSGGKSATAAAAYRAGDEVRDDEQNAVHDYTAKRGVVYNEILLPEHAPEAWRDRAELWNAVQERERAANSQLYREFEVALPRELSRAEQIKLVKDWARAELVARGMCVDIAIHDKGDGNPHAHIMATTRPLNERGEWGAKERKQYALDEHGERVPVIDTRTGEQKREARTGRRVWKRETVQANDWNDRARAEEWRASWARACNERLPAAKRIDHRSNERRGLSRVPTVHIGHGSNRAERRAMNRRAQEVNNEARRLDAERAALQAQAATQQRLDSLSARMQTTATRQKEEKKMDIKNTLAALQGGLKDIKEKRKTALQAAKDTIRGGREDAPAFVRALDKLIKAAIGGDKDAQAFLQNDAKHAPEAWRRDWLYMTEADKDEVRLRRAMRDDYGDENENEKPFMSMTEQERVDRLMRFWEQQQEQERKAQREAEKARKAAKERDKEKNKARTQGGGGRARTKGGGGR